MVLCVRVGSQCQVILDHLKVALDASRVEARLAFPVPLVYLGSAVLVRWTKNI